MKKTNNKFRNNTNNSIYSLNYKFDSVSSAGKFNGTALDLIKRYNELAKEAQSRGDYVDMEVYRQYAEHYRKIVTEINARKMQNRDNLQNQETATENNEVQEAPTEEQPETVDNGLVETEAAPREEITQTPQEKPLRKRSTKRSFTIVEVKEEKEKKQESANENIKQDNIEVTPVEEKPKKRRVLKKNTEVAVKESVQGE